MIAALKDFPAWGSLAEHAIRVAASDPRELTTRAGRADYLTGTVGGVHVDWTRQLVDEAVIHELRALARWRGVRTRISDMFEGQAVNATEGRSVLHTALRARTDSVVMVEGRNVIPDIMHMRTRMCAFSEGVRDGSITGATGVPFTDIVNIGIGGSDLGPAMAASALAPYAHPRLRMHFVSNVDPAHIQGVLSTCPPESTLVLIASKTFTTAETMANAHAARHWLAGALGEGAVTAHLAAMSSATTETRDFGVASERVFGFWDWVGGRYSLASAIGLSLMISIGAARFQEMLDGMHAVDEHFRSADEMANVPMMHGLLAFWNRVFLGAASTAVLPYEQLLSRFPAYLQQLTMESNGKRVRIDGSPVDAPTGPVYWGEPGTNGQHSFHQLLHQGTDRVACDVIAFAQSAYPVGEQHEMLLANALAQAEVLASGLNSDQVSATGVRADLVPHKVIPGGKPTTLMIAAALTPAVLGALIAIYEHSVATQGILWGINSFDQWGVEYGKEVATTLLPMLTGTADSAPDDPNTARSLVLLRSLRG